MNEGGHTSDPSDVYARKSIARQELYIFKENSDFKQKIIDEGFGEGVVGNSLVDTFYFCTLSKKLRR